MGGRAQGVTMKKKFISAGASVSVGSPAANRALARRVAAVASLSWFIGLTSPEWASFTAALSFRKALVFLRGDFDRL